MQWTKSYFPYHWICIFWLLSYPSISHQSTEKMLYTFARKSFSSLTTKSHIFRIKFYLVRILFTRLLLNSYLFVCCFFIYTHWYDWWWWWMMVMGGPYAWVWPTIILFVFAHSLLFYYHYVCLWADNNMSLDGHNNCVFVSVYVRIEFSFAIIFLQYFFHLMS